VDQKFNRYHQDDSSQMRLIEQAYLNDESGQSRTVIDDQPLLDWSLHGGVLPRKAQIDALEAGIVPLRYVKNFSAIDLDEQTRICRSRVLICGCGGLGGILVDLLARVGVGSLRLVDGDTFTLSNLNRQLLCETRQLSQPKALVAKARVHSINPLIEVDAFPEILNENNAEILLEGINLVLDALDNLPGRFVLAEAASRMGIPFIHAAATGWWGQVSTFMPESPLDLTAIYGTKRSRDPAEIAMGVLGPAPAVIGSLQAFEAIRLLASRKPAYAGRLLFFDGESGVVELIPL
jgi:molybdopterin-synthase adenylyltransferase